MERLFFECAVRAALLVAGAALVLYAMRVKSAATKHRMWTVVVLLMLVLPIWTAWGPKAALRLLPPLAQKTAQEGAAPGGTFSIAFLASSPTSSLRLILLGSYFLVFCVLFLRLAIGTLLSRRLVREAVLNGSGVPVSSLCNAPVTVGFFHPKVILPEHWSQWSQAQLDAVLTHEREHARRRDPLVQWLALLNRALFWFHPAAWWLERQLSALAEEACDNVVLARGHNPREYSEYLIAMARSVMRSGGRLNIAGMAMPGSSLPRRIHKIIEGAPVPRVSRTRTACIAFMCAVTCTVFAAGKLDHTPPAAPESSANAAHEPDIKPYVLKILTDTDGVDFKNFSGDLLKAVKRNWYAQIPKDAAEKKGRVTILFNVEKSGAVVHAPIVEVSSGDNALDNAAVAAIRAAAPFERLPDAFKGPEIELRINFYYNVPMPSPRP